MSESTADPDADPCSTLSDWVDAGALRPLDYALTRLVARETPEQPASVLLAVALVSEHNGHGHVCLNLADALHAPERLLSRIQEDQASSRAIRANLGSWLQTLTLSDWVATLGHSAAVEICWRGESSADTTPLVLAGSPEQPLLYLRRYWQYEQTIRQQLELRLQDTIELPLGAARAILDRLFAQPATTGQPPENSVDWQKVACALAAHRGFAIITGGPGTGKTHTVVNLLAFLQSLNLQQGHPPLQIQLAAPTGKAAARLNESIAGTVQGLVLSDIDAVDPEQLRDAIPTQVNTLHRLLGALPNSRHFRHHQANPLPADLVVVDEASMVDVEMMARLLDALRPEARLILIGDKDQLASVEAGAVLGNLCGGAREGHYTPTTVEWLHQVTGQQLPSRFQDNRGQALHQSLTMLRRSYRFRAEGGIGALAMLVNGDIDPHQPAADKTRQLMDLFERSSTGGKLAAAAPGAIERLRLTSVADRAFNRLILAGYGVYLQTVREQYPGHAAPQAAYDAWAATVLQAHGRFQLLTALRRGEWGVEALNQRIQEILTRGDLLSSTTHQWYAGRPVLCTRNDYSLKLMNGDIGMTLPLSLTLDDGSTRHVLRVAFPSGDGSGGIRWILPSRLQQVETVFAMTVHKSQGSEFEHTALILPDTPSPVLTRELLYTGITRSRQQFTLLYSEEAVLRQALEARVERASGLMLTG